MLLPVGVVLALLWHWRLDYKTAIYGVARMLVQLLLIGYVLVYIFTAEGHWLILTVLMVMLLVASWISLRTVPGKRSQLYWKSLAAFGVGCGSVLVLVTQGVLSLDPWYLPQYMIPLAGMMFANTMNSISLGAERASAELGHGEPWQVARNKAFEASMIPITNNLFAVGLVSLPGMMTGQILAGVSPFIAARYQIVVMTMVFGAIGISSAIFLMLARKDLLTAQSDDTGDDIRAS